MDIVSDFTYADLNQKLLRDRRRRVFNASHTYEAAKGDGTALIGPLGFIIVVNVDWSIDPSQFAIPPQGKIFKTCVLKFHISLPENDREAYAQGWNIVKTILMQRSIQGFKVAHEDIRMSGGDGTQRGKDITIEAYLNFDKDVSYWGQLITEITSALKDAGISPGYEVDQTGDRRDRLVQGSHYMSYRYEKGDPPQGDLLAGLVINVPNQQPRQVWNQAPQCH